MLYLFINRVLSVIIQYTDTNGPLKMITLYLLIVSSSWKIIIFTEAILSLMPYICISNINDRKQKLNMHSYSDFCLYWVFLFFLLHTSFELFTYLINGWQMVPSTIHWTKEDQPVSLSLQNADLNTKQLSKWIFKSQNRWDKLNNCTQITIL